MAELEGRTLDRYELRRLIGKGGMANVYEAYDPKIRRAVAIKVFKREDDEMLERFIREANIMARLRHPRLVEVYDTGKYPIDGIMRYYIVMRLLTGGTLRARIRRSPLSLDEVCQCLRDISDALDYIHAQGIIHRDIKASNVLLDDEGRCYLTDFGIARITSEATQLTSTGNVLGTVDYVAPELFEVHRRADERSDFYSLGVLLYEMVAGRLPFSADNQLALISMHVNKQPPSPLLYVPQTPQDVVGVIYRALEKRPEMRYGSARELTDAFCQAVKRGGSGLSQSEQRHGELEPAVMAMGPAGAAPVASAPVSQGPVGRPSPLAMGTEAFPYAPPPLPQASKADSLPETPQPLPLAKPDAGGGSQRMRPRTRRVLALAGVMVVILILVSAWGGYAAYSRTFAPTPTRVAQQTAPAGSTGSVGSQTTPNLTQTAQAGAQATGTASARATASAIANATGTANAQASATVGPLQTATAGVPDYQDSLKNGNSAGVNWDENSQCVFSDDGYHVSQPAAASFFKGCRELNKSYSDLALTVDVNMLSGHSGGIFYRLSTNLLGNYDGYLFEIDSQGNYKVSFEQGTGINVLKDWSPTSLLHPGYQVHNLLQLVARGDTFLFYVNGKFLTKIQNSYDPASNTIGFLATAVQGGDDAEVVYSSLKVYAL